MPKFIIERTIPGLGKLTARELQDVSAKSCRVLHDLGPRIQWLQSYVTEDKLYCVYLASDAELIREHARRGGFPVDGVHEIRTLIDPATAVARPQSVQAGG